MRYKHTNPIRLVTLFRVSTLLAFACFMAPIFGKTAYAQTYASVKTLETQCANKEAAACGLLSAHYATRPRSSENDEKAFTTAKFACDQGHAVGCNTLGISYYIGQGTDTDRVTASEHLEYACKNEQMASCGYLGMMHQFGQAQYEQNTNKAIELYRRGCDADMGFTCALLAQMYRDGEGVEKDPDVAGPLYKRACINGFDSACVEFGFALTEGNGMEVNEAQAFRVFSTQCNKNGGSQSCYAAYAMAHNGQGTDENFEQAVGFLAKGCHGDDYTTCAELAHMHFTNEIQLEDEAAARYAIKACEQNHAEACGLAGYASRVGRGVEKDLDKAALYLKKACASGIKDACTNQ